MSSEQAPKPSLVERLRDQRERHADRPLYLRALIVMVGFTLFLGGVAMLVLFVLLAIAFLALAGTLLIRRLRG
jgi:Flp pilus assembly protein TadB